VDRFPYVSPQEQRRRAEAQAEAQAPRLNVTVGVVIDNDAEGDGVVLAEVSPGSPAAAAGLVAGDRIVRWGGQKLTDTASWTRLLAQNSAGDTVNVGVKGR
jgi:S1-C subfamily serine protease